MNPHPARPAVTRNVARACAAFSAAMLAITVWISTGDEIERANAEVAAGTAAVIVPDDGRPDGGSQLDVGGESTEFTIQLPEGAACPGDSKDAGYRVTSYVVPSSKDPGTLEFDADGPQPQQFGSPQSSFAQPLWDVFGSAYVVAQTADADPPGGLGPIINIPVFSFGVYEPPGSGFDIPAGDYNAGIACFVPVEGASAPVQAYWNVEMTVTQSADSPPVMGWTVTQDVLSQTVLTMDPIGGAGVGDEVTLTATVTPSDATGTVTFSDAGTPIGDPVPVTAGVATLTRSDLDAGTRDFTATFTPSAEGFVGSASAPVTYAIEAEATTTALTAAPVDEAAEGELVTLTATVAPNAAVGTITFVDGTTVLGEGAVTGGVATLAISDLAPGQHTLTASFVPAEGAAHAESTSVELAYTITSESTVEVRLTVDPAEAAQVGEDVELTAVVEPADAEGDIHFEGADGSLGTVPLADGEAWLVLDDLTVGAHSLTARYEPAEGSDYEATTSTAVAYDIVALATTTTTTPTSTTEVPTSTTVALPVVLPDPGGGGSLSTGFATLPLTGGSVSIAFWGALLLVSGRIAVLVGRTPTVLPVREGDA